MDPFRRPTDTRYGSIPDSTQVQTPPELAVHPDHQNNHSFRSRLSSRFSAMAIVAVMCLGSVLFISGRYGHRLIHTNGYPPVSRASPAFRSHTVNELPRSPPWSRRNEKSMLQRTGTGIRSAFSEMRALLSPSWRSIPDLARITSCLEDFAVEERVPTGDCASGLFCRARVTVAKEGDQVTVKAGYIIYPSGQSQSQIREIDASTKRRVGAVTLGEAQTWGATLLSRIVTQMTELNCELTADMIAQAIMSTKNNAADCPNTGDALCQTLITIGTCDVSAMMNEIIETEEQKQCRQYIESSPTVTGFEDLKSGPCGHVEFFYNRASMSVPFCTTTCPSSACPDQKRMVFTDLWVQTNKRGPQPADCTAAVLIPAYNALYKTIPTCEVAMDKNFGTWAEARPYLASIKPEYLQTIADAYGCWVTYVFPAVPANSPYDSMEDRISAACA